MRFGPNLGMPFTRSVNGKRGRIYFCLGDDLASQGDCPSPPGDGLAPQGDCPAPLGDGFAPLGDDLAPQGDYSSPLGDEGCPPGGLCCGVTSRHAAQLLQNKNECRTIQVNLNNTPKTPRIFMPEKQKTDWHRLLGLIFTDFFTGSAWNVELEKDLSMKRQLLDIIILRQDTGTFIDPLPDGLEGMKKHNLLTFKSIREPLDDWTLKELTGHYVNYRKQISPSFHDLYPEDEFQLYGISARYPKKLFSQQLELTKVQDGVYDIRRGSDDIRLIVLNEIPHAQHNAIWHLFSGIPGEVEFAARQYKSKTQEISTVLNSLFENYNLEGIPVSYTMQDFQRDYVKDHLKVLSPDEVMNSFSPDDRLKGLSSDDLLQRISFEEIQLYLKKHSNRKKKK